MNYKTHYIFVHSNETVSHHKNVTSLAHEASCQERNCETLEITESDNKDAVYIEGSKSLYLIEESEFYSILLFHGYDISNWEYIETESQGDYERAVFHEIPQN